MAASKVLHGARLKVRIFDRATGKPKVIGIFNTISYGLRYSTEPIYILGAYGPVETVITSQEVVSIQASGWRVFGHGAHKEVGMPALQDLLNAEYLEGDVIDRQAEEAGTDGRMTKFRNMRVTGYQTSINARGVEEISVEMVALRVDDESTTNTESGSATQLP